MTQTERRRHPRIPISLPLQLTIQDETVDTVIINLSETGIRLRTPKPMQLLSRVQIGIELPEAKGVTPESVAITGVIVRSEPTESADIPFDTAIFFEDLSDAARGSISRFISAQLA
jgi:hypothetical protein